MQLTAAQLRLVIRYVDDDAPVSIYDTETGSVLPVGRVDVRSRPRALDSEGTAEEVVIVPS